jgi:hypothetical protein
MEEVFWDEYWVDRYQGRLTAGSMAEDIALGERFPGGSDLVDNVFYEYVDEWRAGGDWIAPVAAMVMLLVRRRRLTKAQGRKGVDA